MRILIADDDPVARLLLASVLEALHHEVVVCADGEEAWRAYCAQPPHIVISDWRMPGPDGLELCRLIRSRSSERPQFLLCSSACDTAENQARAKDAGVDDIIGKPFDQELLGRRLHLAGERLGESAQAAGF